MNDTPEDTAGFNDRPEEAESMTNPRAPRSNGSAKPHRADDGGARTVCEITRANAFSAGYDQLPVPVVVAFGDGRLHQHRREISCDLDRAIEENGEAFIRSHRNHARDDPSAKWEELLFKFGPKAFLHANDHRIVGYGRTASEAERQVKEFSKKYAGTPKPSGGSFQLIKVDRYDDIETETVSLDVSTILSDERLDLHFRDGFAQWHRDFSGRLCDSTYGLSIFEGTPGTGKTSYLRHLMGALKESHRFYFIPTSGMSVLSDPKFIEFWSSQRRANKDRKFIVVLEDSDAALMTRGSDNSRAGQRHPQSFGRDARRLSASPDHLHDQLRRRGH